jgi:hypothetical protein
MFIDIAGCRIMGGATTGREETAGMEADARPKRKSVGPIRYRRLWTGLTLVPTLLLSAGLPARAGNVPENALLIIDPENADSLYVGNYYKQARNIPDRNVLYMKPDPSSWASFLTFQHPAFTGMLVNRLMDDHIDYVILPPGGGYRMNVTSGLITDGCSAVTKFAVASAYTMSQINANIVPGTPVMTINQYYRYNYSLPSISLDNNTIYGFDANTNWINGLPVNPGGAARRYYIGALLGYSGPNGNTIAQTLEMIDRSVAVDGTLPPGTFYYVETNDPLRSDPRDGNPLFDAAYNFLAARDYINNALNLPGIDAVKLGNGVQLIVLPPDGATVLGCMTGWAAPQIEEANVTIVPGAFGDHLTSYAGFFGETSQTKMSEWITKGCSGSVGAVEEPCNYPGKFPNPRMHVFYAQGATLGEATFRSLQYVPFQMLLYGDPLTRPFARIPQISVSGAPDPDTPVSGNLVLTPTGTTAQPGATVNYFELHVDGVLSGLIMPPGSISVNTAALADGAHDFRMLGRDSTPTARWGRTTFTVHADNFGRSATVSPNLTYGTRATNFNFQISAAGGAVAEMHLMQNQRVLAATTGSAAVTLPVRGATLGAGTSRVQAVAEFLDGRLAVSDPLEIQVSSGATGDADGDADIDLADAAQFVGCLNGPGVTPSNPACLTNFTLDVDQDVDLADAQLFLDGFTGNVPITPPAAYGYTFRFAPGGKPALLELPAFDARGAAMTYTVLINPAQATVSGTGPYRLVTPNAGAAGIDAMTFRATGAGLNSNIATITLAY